MPVQPPADVTAASAGEAAETEAGADASDGAAAGVRHSKAKNFNLKKKLIRADSKLRELINAAAAGAGRRGSAPGTVGSSSTANVRSPTLSVTSPSQETAFPMDEAALAEADRCPSVASSGCSSVVDVAAAAAAASASALSCEPDGTAPVAPPRRKNRPRPPPVSTLAALTKWPSNDAVLAADVLDLRFDQPGGGEPVTPGFLDNFVRKFNSKKNRPKNRPTKTNQWKTHPDCFTHTHTHTHTHTQTKLNQHNLHSSSTLASPTNLSTSFCLL